MTDFFKTFVLGTLLIASCTCKVLAQDFDLQEDEEKTEEAAKPDPKTIIAPKTDEQIRYEDDNLPENWDDMTQLEQEKYAFKVLEDRFILTTMNFKVITSGSTKLCTFNVMLNNNSPRKINKIYVKYHWGESSTFASFGGVAPLGISVGTISMVGDVCTRLTKGADYEVKTCNVEGLSEEQCKMRVYPVK